MKKLSIIILSVLLGLFAVVKGLEWLIESKFEARINANPDRAYDITYADFDLGTFFKGVTLDDLKITPLNPGNGSVITAEVDYATINGLVWLNLLTGHELKINEIAFERPIFEVVLSNDTTNKTSGKGMQALFGDILSRVRLKSFSIQNGSVDFIDPNDQSIKGQIKRANILATEIETDSLKFEHLIPFEVGDLNVDLDGITFKPNDYTNINLGSFHYNLTDKEILLNDISLGYSIDWIEVSNREGIQNDIIELNAKEIAIHKLEPSSDFYTQLDIDAQKISVDGLNIKLQRNKNFPRPPDTTKPMFQGIINAIPMAILIDSVQISNSTITYGELGVKKHESGSIEIQDMNGIISGLTNMPEEQKKIGQLNAKINSSLAGKAGVSIDLSVPYDNETFSMAVDVGAMDLTGLNPTLKPLAGVEIVSGQMSRIQFAMNAGPIRSQNRLVIDYSDFHLNLIKETNKDKSHKKVLLSSIANGAIRTNNLPDQKNYLIANYQSSRNKYRSPINYIIQGLVQGFTRIVPGKLVQKMIIKDNKKKKNG